MRALTGLPSPDRIRFGRCHGSEMQGPFGVRKLLQWTQEQRAAFGPVISWTDCSSSLAIKLAALIFKWPYVLMYLLDLRDLGIHPP